MRTCYTTTMGREYLSAQHLLEHPMSETKLKQGDRVMIYQRNHRNLLTREGYAVVVLPVEASWSDYPVAMVEFESEPDNHYQRTIYPAEECEAEIARQEHPTP